ncbi:MAG: c-type cytochrome [Planctomycetes bacterium]|nr:c-type cytochrome [Planctomycetota bacterium]
MRWLLSSSLLLSLFAACSSEAAQAKVDPLKAPLGLESVELVTNPDNPLTMAKAELGKQLFFDARLSGTGTMGCNSCHYPEQAFTDGGAVSKKDDGKDNTRNSPTMHNVGYLDRLYWDGRAKSLEGNVGAAWKAQLGGKPEEVAARLATVPEYQKAFQAAFGAPPSETTIVQALASFLRQLRTGDSAYDRFQAGQQDALSDAAKAGRELFVGKAGCSICHLPPLFTNRGFHNVGIGMAAEKPDVGAAGKAAFDDPARTGQFKTPTLRDIAKTAPYFHDGSVATLKEAVRLMASGGLANPQKDATLQDKKLSDAEIDQLVAFLESLTGNVAFVPPTVPK